VFVPFDSWSEQRTEGEDAAQTTACNIKACNPDRQDHTDPDAVGTFQAHGQQGDQSGC